MSSTMKRKRQSNTSASEVVENRRISRTTKTITTVSIVEEEDPTPKKSRRLSASSPLPTSKNAGTPSKRVSDRVLETPSSSLKTARRSSMSPMRKETAKSKTPSSIKLSPTNPKTPPLPKEYANVPSTRKRSSRLSDLSGTLPTSTTPSRSKLLRNETEIEMAIVPPASKARTIRLKRKSRSNARITDDDSDTGSTSSSSSSSSRKSTILLNDFIDDMVPISISKLKPPSVGSKSRSVSLTSTNTDACVNSTIDSQMPLQHVRVATDAEELSELDEEDISKYFGLLVLVVVLLFYVQYLFLDTKFTHFRGIAYNNNIVAQHQDQIMTVYNQKLLLFEQLKLNEIEQVDLTDNNSIVIEEVKNGRDKPENKPNTAAPLCSVLNDQQFNMLDEYYQKFVQMKYENGECTEKDASNCIKNKQTIHEDNIQRMHILRDVLHMCTSSEDDRIQLENSTVNESMKSDQILLDILQIVQEDTIKEI